VTFFNGWKLRYFYKNDLEGLREEVFYIFPELMRTHLKKVYTHLTTLNIAPSFFITQWCLELFFTHLPFELLMRFMDLFLLEGSNLLYAMSLALLQLNQDKLLACTDMEGINDILKGNPAEGLDFEALLKAALNKKFKWKPKKLDKLLEAGKENQADFL